MAGYSNCRTPQKHYGSEDGLKETTIKTEGKKLDKPAVWPRRLTGITRNQADGDELRYGMRYLLIVLFSIYILFVFNLNGLHKIKIRAIDKLFLTWYDSTGTYTLLKDKKGNRVSQLCENEQIRIQAWKLRKMPHPDTYKNAFKRGNWHTKTV